MRSGISNMACLLFSILLNHQVSKRGTNPADKADILDSQLPLVLVALDLLANTGTPDAQTQLDPLA
jgi:hypothetical protein